MLLGGVLDHQWRGLWFWNKINRAGLNTDSKHYYLYMNNNTDVLKIIIIKRSSSKFMLTLTSPNSRVGRVVPVERDVTF